MNDKELAKRLRILREDIDDEGDRIRRYTMDPHLKGPAKPGQTDPAVVREKLDELWKRWAALRGKVRGITGNDDGQVDAAETEILQLEREIDLVQRELISDASFQAGMLTITWLVTVLLALAVFYLVGHGVYSTDFSNFEPWAEWGPLKYAEVACWGAFGALCSLLFKASHYLARRDFDKWYRSWYISTFLRAPFLTVILMLVVLEFVEWYGEDTWIQTYLLEEGSKFYFIVFMSFCLGLTTDTTASLMRDLSEGVTEFVSRVVNRIADKLSTAVSKEA